MFRRKRRRSAEDARRAAAEEQEVSRAFAETDALLKAGDRGGAMECIRAAETRFPEAYMLYVAEATLHFGTGALLEAIEALAIALCLEPDNPLGHCRLAQGLARRGRDVAARAVLERAWALSVRMRIVDTAPASRDAFFAVLSPGTDDADSAE